MIDKCISEEYRQLNAELYETNEKFGSNNNSRWVRYVKQIAAETTVTSVLDYGCGKSNLIQLLEKEGFAVKGYDPAIPEYEAVPESGSDLVVCCDVLEHVEKEFLNETLDRLRKLASNAFFAVVAMKPSDKTLSDGRNTHITLFPPKKWERLLKGKFPGGERVSFRNRNKLIFKWVK